jgi:hypothetical protein
MKGSEYVKSRNIRERVHTENPDVNGRIILKLILEKQDGRFWKRMIWFTKRCKEERL